MNKCKGCERYGKPYWSIINPCDNCPRENTNVEIITRWEDPTIEELETQLQQKENIIKEVREYIEEHTTYERYGYIDELQLVDLDFSITDLKQILDKENKE